MAGGWQEHAGKICVGKMTSRQSGGERVSSAFKGSEQERELKPRARQCLRPCFWPSEGV